MVFDIDDSVHVFEPEYGGNRSLPDGERIRIHVGTLSFVADNRAIRRAQLRVQAEKRPAQELTDLYYEECFAERVHKIEGLNVRTAGGTVEPVTDPRRLYAGSGALASIATEVVRYIVQREDVGKKKLASPLGSGSKDSEGTSPTRGPTDKPSSSEAPPTRSPSKGKKSPAT